MNALKTVGMSIGVGLLAALFATQATAGCSSVQPRVAPSLWQQPQFGPGQGQLMTVAFQQVADFRAAIVGLWKFSFVAQGNGASGPPDGTPIDAGYATWHEDGTELMNSGRAPTTGDFCMGVWVQIGHSTYELNHFALAWAFDPNAPITGPGTGGADFVGPANIREVVTLDGNGNHYAGTFTLIQYATDEKTVLADIKGIVKGTRITVNSSVDD
jgi:hypothetical protein